MEDYINVVFAIDNGYVQHASVLMCSLFENNRNSNFHIYIVAENLTKRSKEIFYEIASKHKNNVEFLEEIEDFIYELPTLKHLTSIVYYRLLLEQLLPKSIEKVLFLDCDIVCRGDISKLWNIDLEGFSHAAGIDHDIDEFGKNNGSRRRELQMDPDSIYFNAGVMLINLKYWRLNSISDKVVKYMKEFPDRILWLEQDALNALTYKHYIQVSSKFNAVNLFFANDSWPGVSQEEFLAVKNHPILIHYNTSSKPWFRENKHPFKNEYYKYLKMTPFKNYSPNLNYVRRKFDGLIKKVFKFFK